jgi:hypothetical protein
MYRFFVRPRLGGSYTRITKIFQHFIFHLPISDYSFKYEDCRRGRVAAEARNLYRVGLPRLKIAVDLKGVA